MRELFGFTKNPIIREFIDTIPAAFFIKDSESRILLMNRACEEQWGGAFSDLYMTDGSGHFSPEDVQRFKEKDQQVFETGMQQEFRERIWNNRLKSYRSGYTIKRPVQSADGQKYLIAVTTDISAQSDAESALAHIDNKMHAVMSQMTSSLAHEVNQPLTAVTNWIQAARRKLLKSENEPPQDVMDYLDHAIEQTHFAAKVISNLRDFVAKGEMEIGPARVNAIIEDTLTVALVGAHRAGIKLELSLAPDLPYVMVDKVQIQQVIINLVRNAVQAMKKSPVRRLLIASGMCEGGLVEVRIQDTGPGLSDDVREQLFRPFVSTKSKGMGLGLSICKTIVEAHGGQLIAQPKSETGTVFTFTLPTSSNGSATKIHEHEVK